MDHPVVSDMAHLGLRPMVHSGFYRAWTDKGLNLQVIDQMQVPSLAALLTPLPAPSMPSLLAPGTSTALHAAQGMSYA